MKRERKAGRTELVPKTIAPNWELLGRRRVEVACRETAETTVSETGVTLLVDEVLEVEAELVNAVLVLLLEAEVEERIVERAAHQELEREVVRALGRLARVVQLRLVPVHLWRDIGKNESECIRKWSHANATYEKVVANGERRRLVGTEVVQVVRLTCKGGVDMVYDGLGDGSGI